MEYRITLFPGSHVITAAEDEPLLNAMQRQGWHAPFSCRKGTCGTCRARVLQGEVGYPEPPAVLEEADPEGRFVLLCVARPRSDLELEIHGLTDADLPAPRAWPVRVAALDRLAAGIMSVRLQLAVAANFEFVPGQYVDVLLRDGTRRSFSIAALHMPEAEDRGVQIELHIRRVEGGYFTSHVFTQLKIGDMLRLYGPLGTFFLRDSDRSVVMISGGTGFAPMKAMLAAALPQSGSRKFHLFCGMPVESDLYMREWADAETGQFSNFKFTPVLSAANDRWKGARGWVHETLIALCPDIQQQDIYIAGPPEMVDVVHTRLLERGVPGTQIFTDAFEFSPHGR